MILDKISKREIFFKVQLSDIFLFLSAVFLLCRTLIYGNLNEDAFIIFRSIENFINGNGLQYVIDDRSQSYTDPLWIICHVLLRLVFDNIHLISIYFAITCTACMVFIIFHYFKTHHWLAAFFIFIPLSFSPAFLEYSTSGLENSLSHFLAAWFFCIFLTEKNLKNISNQKIFFLSTLACFAVLNRFDTVIFYAAPLFYIACIRKNAFIKTSLIIASAFFPLIVWLAFATFYYGYPLPDTYYAKLSAGTPTKLMIFFSLNYYYRFIETNLSSALLILSALTISTWVIFRKTHNNKIFFKDESLIKIITTITSIILYLSYCVTIGDYMLGRFFTITLLVSLILLTHLFAHADFGKGKNLLLTSVFITFSLAQIVNIFSTNFIYDCSATHKINDDSCSKESLYEWKSWVHTYWLFGQSWNFILGGHKLTDWQDLGWMIKVISLLDETKRPFHVTHYSAGIMPFYAGPYYWITDQLGYTDPFLVRLPASNHKPGHFVREVPPGYIEWRFYNNDSGVSDDFKNYYNELRYIKTAPLFDKARLTKIILFNRGIYDEHLTRYKNQVYIPQMTSHPDYLDPISKECSFLDKNKNRAADSPFYNFLCSN